ncbi:hypothetical protein NQ315_000992 [Exocentrus adspersus]|uniref:Uncharacterized protein n=1 Tax=Exocentrus adspersus TaxID=1586481 RepID=A0AAV8WER8_9CUCU|nr:hypothetical protein NQ315_000992 [Exocentrus adspersus]
MKLFLCLSLLSLKLALASSQTLTQRMFELISANEKIRSDSRASLTQLYDDTKLELNKQLNRNAVPALKEVYEDIEVYIQSLDNKTYFSGYDAASCINSFRSSLPNITEKALKEMDGIYENIASISYAATHNLDIISREVNTISSDYAECIKSSTTEYCDGALSKKLATKQGQLPRLYKKEVERTRLGLVQVLVDYESRVQDYVEEAVLVAKPYLAVLEHCVYLVITIHT